MHATALREAERRRRCGGFSLVEMVVATVSMTFVFGASMLILSGTKGAFEVGGTRSSLQEVGRRVLEEVLEDVRQSGLTSVPGQPMVNFPQIWQRPAGNLMAPRGPWKSSMSYLDALNVDELEAITGNGNRILDNQNDLSEEFAYQLPADLNGNGRPTDNNGVLTFSPNLFSFRVITDPNSGIPTLVRIESDQLGNMVRFDRIGSFVQSITFDVVSNDASLRFGEVAVVVYLQKTNARGQLITAALEGSVTMRNTREL